jgi:hypothetical protein
MFLFFGGGSQIYRKSLQVWLCVLIYKYLFQILLTFTGQALHCDDMRAVQLA